MGRLRLLVVAAVSALLAACQSPLGQFGFDARNSGENAAEIAITPATVTGLTADWSLDLTAYDTTAAPGELVSDGHGNVIVTSDHQVLSITPDGSVAWHTPIPDAHPEIPGAHISAVYGNGPASTIDVSVDLKVQGPAPSRFGGKVVHLDAATGAPTGSEDSYRPAAPIGYGGNRLLHTGWITDGFGTSITTIEGHASGSRAILGSAGSAHKPAVSGNHVALVVGDRLYQWTAPCPQYEICEPTAATSVPGATRPAISGSTVYVASAGDQKLYAVATDGSILWEGATFPGPTAVSVAENVGRVFVSGVAGATVGFALAGCAAAACPHVFALTLSGAISAPSTHVPGLGFVATADRLYAFRSGCSLVEDCSPVWSANLPGGSARQVLVVDGRVYALSTTGRLHSSGL